MEAHSLLSHPSEQCIAKGTPTQKGVLADETHFQGIQDLMHKTSTTTLSDSIDRLREWDSVLSEASWTPVEILLDTCAKITVIITLITESTTDDMFSAEEIDLMFSVTRKAEEVSHDILLSQQEGDSYEYE